MNWLLLTAAEDRSGTWISLLITYALYVALLAVLVIVYIRMRKRDAVPAVHDLELRVEKELKELEQFAARVPTLGAVSLTRDLVNAEYRLSELSLVLVRAAEERRDLRYEDADALVTQARERLKRMNADLKLSREEIVDGLEHAKAEIKNAQQIILTIAAKEV